MTALKLSSLLATFCSYKIAENKEKRLVRATHPLKCTWLSFCSLFL